MPRGMTGSLDNRAKGTSAGTDATSPERVPRVALRPLLLLLLLLLPLLLLRPLLSLPLPLLLLTLLLLTLLLR